MERAHIRFGLLKGSFTLPPDERLFAPMAEHELAEWE